MQVEQGVAVEPDIVCRGNQELNSLFVVEDHLALSGVAPGRRFACGQKPLRLQQ